MADRVDVLDAERRPPESDAVVAGVALSDWDRVVALPLEVRECRAVTLRDGLPVRDDVGLRSFGDVSDSVTEAVVRLDGEAEAEALTDRDTAADRVLLRLRDAVPPSDAVPVGVTDTEVDATGLRVALPDRDAEGLMRLRDALPDGVSDNVSLVDHDTEKL